MSRPWYPGEISRDDLDRAVAAVRQHIDVVRLDDEFRLRVPLLFCHDFRKLRIVVSSGEPLIPFRLGRIAPDVDEGVRGTDTEVRVALLRNPIADVCDAVPRVNCRRSVCKAG